MFVAAVCIIFLIELKWPKIVPISNIYFDGLVLAKGGTGRGGPLGCP